MKIKSSFRQRSIQTISTASLPDIIFILLFFFMTVTVLRKQQVMVKNILPKASEVQQIKNKSKANYIYIGQPLDPLLGDATRIQINDAFASLVDIDRASRVSSEKFQISRSALTTALKADQGVNMGTVMDVKETLRKAEQYKLVYIAESEL